MNKQTSLFENGLIWFGAGVSIAEILTGTYLAPLGFQKGVLAIILGHLIGCVLFFLAGVIGGQKRKTAMDSTKMSFGSHGGLLFALLNVIQLFGWTAIMIYDGAISAASIFHGYQALWCVIIGALIVLWIYIGITNLGKLNTITMAALFILSIVLCVVITASGNHPAALKETISFGAALELSASMPLSWLPVVADCIKDAKQPVKATLVSTITYGLTSGWMFLIGMMASIMTGQSDIAAIMLKAGLGIVGLIIIVLSTVTTTFLDALSAGISAESINAKLSGKWVGIIAAIVGTIAAIVYPMDNITNFLYLIGSVFAPMIAVMIGDYFILHHDHENESFHWLNLIIWLIGFILYRIFMRYDFVFGYTLPDIVITLCLTVILNKIVSK